MVSSPFCNFTFGGVGGDCSSVAGVAAADGASATAGCPGRTGFLDILAESELGDAAPGAVGEPWYGDPGRAEAPGANWEDGVGTCGVVADWDGAPG